MRRMKLLIWGTGKLAKQFIQNEYCGEIIGFIETKRSCETFMGLPVYCCAELPDGYDFIVVANSHVAEVRQECLNRDIDLNKVIFLYGVKSRIGYTEQPVIQEILMEKNYTEYCAEFGLTHDAFFRDDMEKYSQMNHRSNFEIKNEYLWPVISDKYAKAGTINNYFWQDLWAARLIYGSGKKSHFDIGSRIDGFIAHLLAMNIDVTLIDIREFPEEIEGLHTIIDNATMLRQVPDNSIESMSALCSLEHFGLGRYGDPIDPEACFKCFNEIQKKIKAGGDLYLSVPIGQERVEFNAHRVFYADTIRESFSGMQLVEYSCVSEGKLERNVAIHKYDDDSHNGEFRYGLFYFKKL